MSQLPPLKTILKSTEVEDPVNIWVHRPLAYAFVWSIFKTAITPNMVTLLAIVAGVVSGVMVLWGTPYAMIAAGVLLWASAILDGADGLLARAKNMQSQFGRALDGSADAIVAICTVFPVFYHIWVTYRDPWHLFLMVPVILLTLVHLAVYDHYKDNFLRGSVPEEGGEGRTIEEIEATLPEARERGLLEYLAVKHTLLLRARQQAQYVGFIDPQSLTPAATATHDAQTVEIFRKHNTGPMRLWAVISLAPHSYLMAMCMMADRLDVYLFIRLFFMNAVFLVAAIWQRRATEATIRELANVEAVGVPAAQPAIA